MSTFRSSASLQALPPGADGRRWHRLPAEGIFSGDFLWLREPADADLKQAVKQIRTGRYRQPFALDSIRSRRLHFGLRYVQSEMLMDYPDALTLTYTRQMMAFLPLLPEPKDLMIVGLGGGSLTKFCYRYLPRTRITTVEINPEVIEFSRLFHLPAEDTRHRIVLADAAEHLANVSTPLDVVLLDGCDAQGTARRFCSAEFFEELRDKLSPDGMAVINLIGVPSRASHVLEDICDAFDDQVLVLNAHATDNRLVFAFRRSCARLDWIGAEERAVALTKTCRLDFHQLLRMLRDAESQA